eukprot:gene18398-31827_t
MSMLQAKRLREIAKTADSARDRWRMSLCEDPNTQLQGLSEGFIDAVLKFDPAELTQEEAEALGDVGWAVHALRQRTIDKDNLRSFPIDWPPTFFIPHPDHSIGDVWEQHKQVGGKNNKKIVPGPFPFGY